MTESWWRSQTNPPSWGYCSFCLPEPQMRSASLSIEPYPQRFLPRLTPRTRDPDLPQANHPHRGAPEFLDARGSERQGEHRTTTTQDGRFAWRTDPSPVEDRQSETFHAPGAWELRQQGSLPRGSRWEQAAVWGSFTAWSTWGRGKTQTLRAAPSRYSIPRPGPLPFRRPPSRQ